MIRPEMTTVVRGWVPVLIAIVAGSWVLTMPFQHDDYLILPRVGEALGFDPELRSQDSRSETHIGNFYLFRPVPWFVWWTLIEVHGGHADPFVFHAVMLAFHALSAFLVWRILRELFDPRAALLGACFFAIAPGAIQATSFIAAGGDLFAVLFMLLATRCLQSQRRKPSVAKAVASGLCAGLAFCSKDVAIASLPAAFLAAVAVPASQRGTLRGPIVAIGLSLVAAVTIRAWYLGTWQPAYLGSVHVVAEDLLKIPGLFLELLLPWRRFEGVTDLPPVSGAIGARLFGDAFFGARILALGAFLLPIAAGTCVRPFRTILRMICIAPVLACVLGPPLAIYDQSYTQVISRVLYPASAIAAGALAAGLDPLCATRLGRKLLWPLLLPLLAICVDLMVHVARTELRAGALIRLRLESMREVIAKVPPGSHIIAVDEQFALGGIPFLYFGITPAMKPPLSRTSARVTWWGNLSILPRGTILQEEHAPIAIARISEDRYVLREPIIPSLPDTLPPIAATAGDPSEWRFAEPVPARAVTGLRVASAFQGTFACTWIGSRGKRESRGALPGLGGVKSAIISAPEDFDWLADPLLVGVRFEGAGVTGVEPLTALPEIVIVEPKDRARIPVGPATRLTVPEVSFKPPDQPPSQQYRVTVEFAIHDRDRPMMIFDAPAFILQERPEGVWAYDVMKRSSLVIVPAGATTAENFESSLDDALKHSGSGLIALSIRLEAFDPRSRSVEARSRWRICFLERR
jgi:hypothetical protein